MSSSNNNLKKLNKLYRILGVRGNSTKLELRSAYLKLVKRYHPDKNPEEKVKFIDICSAYHILTNPERREQFLTNSNTHPAKLKDYYDVFSEIIAESFLRHAEKQRIEKLCRAADIGLNLYVHQQISLKDVYFGRELTVNYDRMIICQQCHGHGKTPVYNQCSICQGSGKVNRRRKKKKRHGHTHTPFNVICGDCSGTGRVREFEQCNQCRGNKYIKTQNSIQVQIPMGGPADGKIRIPKQGHETRGEETTLSDLVILFHLRHHPVFDWQVNTSTLCAHVSISLSEALLGFDRVLLVHLDGRQIKVSQPVGKIIYPGASMRIPGEGMRYDNKNESKNLMDGDLLIEFNVEFPTKLILSTNMIEQLTSTFSLNVSPMNDTSFIRFEQGGGNSVFLGRSTASFSSSPSIKDDEDKRNNDGPVVERLMINENALNGVDDIDDVKKTDTVKKIRSLQRRGFCPQCVSKPLFDEKIFVKKASCSTDNTQLVGNCLFDMDMYETEDGDHSEEEEDLYS
ncbi:hypothetical protein INT45_002052 [Circinella minor]|uniref:Uncharacterized protein n=1 Tax=Circinella minor TaxID=1195481 RepID=A0A8H7VUQ9_9FUNG|nr:hypothetical protein INT45_002052 [Circinella minor]